MAKKPTGLAPGKSGKPSPIAKQAVPMKNPAIQPMALPTTGASAMPKIASIPKLTRPAPMAPRTPRI